MTKPLSPKQQFWKNHIEQALSEKMSLSSYAKHYDLDVKALYTYKSLLQKKGVLPAPESGFAKINVVSKQTDVCPSLIHVRFPNGVILQLSDINPTVLASLMAL